MLPAPGHTYGNSIIIAEDGGLFYMFHGDISYTDEALYADKLSIVYDDIYLTRSTQNTIREFIRNHPTVYCGTHTPLGYENLEAKRIMDLDNPPKTIWPTEMFCPPYRQQSRQALFHTEGLSAERQAGISIPPP